MGKRRADRLRAAGRCVTCKEPRGKSGTAWYCRLHADKASRYHRAWHARNREANLARMRAYTARVRAERKAAAKPTRTAKRKRR